MGVIDAYGLTMQFGSMRALDALEVDVPHGITGLVGANGAGKTTFMSIVLGLRPPTAGRVEVLGLDPQHDGARLRALLGYGPEHHVMPDEMPASDFVKHMAEVRGMPRAEARGRASDALWLVGLGEERFRALGTMSTGQRQRVKLAQAIAADPRLILLDEPTDGLDPVQRDEMLALIRQISAEYQIDVLLSSHLLEEVERICDNVVALDAGRLVAQGPLAALVGADGGVIVDLVDVPDRPGAPAAVADFLGRHDFEVRHDGVAGTRIEVIGSDPDAIADAVRDAVVSADARVGRIVRRRRRLEDLFHGAER
ncbi:MAG: ABC transporter ATP-binding protein [Ilumatobacter sp.]|uniref:ABC transporter ATP-binding protein n=1 Tax=Ilumatobacter sp. TaxID=1967498 RepID=UPI002637F66A|nr:ABC transporter ATP-binding protein [Ilumatobacter sp.]MDJ0768235.1 ABC transporter ATP-binding protein [Ilumatobacter sp.]